MKIICPFCNKKLPLEVENMLNISQDCQSCNAGGGSIKSVIIINCPNCNKEIYRKEDYKNFNFMKL
jgi:predicted RNA-binding Zn-ribbon protein involved in translation (DUF1610 family)